MIDARDFLDAVAGYSNSATGGPQSSANRPIKLGTIDPYYTSGPARVMFDGESALSDRGYSWVATYAPVASERVYLIPVGQTYLIGGDLASTVPYARYHDIDLNEAGGWQTYSASFHNPSFTKTPSGVVKLTGLGKHSSITGAVGDNFIIGYLPEGFRPPIEMDFPCMTGSANDVGVIRVWPDGDISTKNNVHGAWWSLGNIAFHTEDLAWTDATLQNGWVDGSYSGWTRKAQYAKDAYNRIWLRGAFGDPVAPAPGSDSTVFTTPTGFRPSPQGVYTVGSSTLGTGDGFSHFFWNPTTGTFSWRVNSDDASEVSIDGVIAPPADASWITPTLAGTWVSYGSGNTPGYYKDADGLVHLRGLVKSGTINTAIFTLPVGYRPAKNIIRNTPSNGLPARLDITSAGVVQAVTGSNLWVSLDSVVFTAEA